MPRQSTWSNSDGLVVGFGTHSVDDKVLAEASNGGAFKVAQMVINGTDVATAVTAASIPPQALFLKRGSRITRAHLEVVVPFTGASSTLSIGTYKADATVDVAAGLASALALTAIDGIGETVVCAGTLVNAAIPVGATSDSDVTIMPTWGTAALTAGKGILTVEYVEPDYNQTIAA